jgi:hypothetical protein
MRQVLAAQRWSVLADLQLRPSSAMLNRSEHPGVAMRITQSHCDFAFAVARNARAAGLTLEQFQDLAKAAWTVLDDQAKRREEMDRADSSHLQEGEGR